MIDRTYAIIRTLENKIAIAERIEQNILFITLDVMREILELLKEQEPVKPRYTPQSIYSWECGVCAEPFDRIANYCPNCGRAVRWK